VILDNLSSHKVTGVEKAITTTGATLRVNSFRCPSVISIKRL